MHVVIFFAVEANAGFREKTECENETSKPICHLFISILMRQQSLVLASSKILFSLTSLHQLMVICQHFNRTLYIANLGQTNASEPGFELAQFCSLVLTHSEHDELRSY